jgi:hypothetical protein
LLAANRIAATHQIWVMIMNTDFDHFSGLFRQVPGEFLLRPDLNTRRIRWVFQGGTRFHHTASLGITGEDESGAMPGYVQTLEKTGAASVTAYGVRGADTQVAIGPADAAQTEGERDRVVFRKRYENQAKRSTEKKSGGWRGPNRGFYQPQPTYCPS